ncbi:MAG: HEAT repeat domain-containing protein [Phormidesmis sp. CAN_BIN44]|nr:HEAT repeat domain-containing protein [Phormidesmis sp. CAN_BIN44]
MQELARGWKDDPETLPILKSLAQSDGNRYVQDVAVQELARGWKDDPETEPILKSLAQSDGNRYVRRVVVQELAQGWKDDPTMFEFLSDRTLHDPFERKYDRQENPRQTALEAIIKHYPAHAQTRELLSDRAQNDPDEEVREFATQKLAELEQQT